MQRNCLLGLLLTIVAVLHLTREPVLAADGVNGCQPPSYPFVNVLTQPTEQDRFIDGRPVFSPDGETVLFMRGPVPTGEPSSLYTIPISGGPVHEITPVGCSGDEVPNVEFSVTRPDWSWHRRSFQVAFAASSSIYLLDMETSQCRRILKGNPSQHAIYSYPAWYPDGRRLAITNYWSGVDQEGCSTELNPEQYLFEFNVRRRLAVPITSPNRIWPGMSSVAQNPVSRSPLIAFAGESPLLVGNYCQNDNQIWVRLPHGRLRQVDGRQGRAPWWSPSGQLIAFESDRCEGNGAYQIFIQDPSQPEHIAAVTPPGLQVQHAKWSPDGRMLVFAYQAGDVGQGIAYINLPEGDPLAASH